MDVVIKNWVSLNLVPRASFPEPALPPPLPPRERKSPGNEAGLVCGLYVNRMVEATLEIENPIETAVSRGASLVEPEKASAESNCEQWSIQS